MIRETVVTDLTAKRALPDAAAEASARRLVALGALLAVLSSAACRKSAPPSWMDVVASVDRAQVRIVAGDHTLPGGRKARLKEEQGSVHLELTLLADDWEREPQVGFWLARTELALTGGARTDPAGFSLVSDTRAFTPAPSWAPTKESGSGFPPGTFQVSWKGVLIRLTKRETPPAQMTLSLALQGGGAGNGRVLGRRFSGRGFQIWPGQALALTLDVPEAYVLRFATTLEPLLADALDERGEGERARARPTVYRILQDGFPVFEHSVSDPTQAGHAWHAVALPHTGRRSALTFEVSGTLAITSFLAPVLAPAEIGAPGRRPWQDSRPDILLFLADTFRADNLRAYGSQRGLTPNIDRLADESLLFTRAWSVGTYTLPSHVSMFTGVMPYQAGLRTIQNALPESMETIAEVLALAGYRIGAITDAGIVSRRFAFDQGFPYFDEKQIEIDSTVERALSFLDADDGRPMFLFVHSYRAHAPYRVSAETRRTHGQRLGIEGEYRELEERLTELARQRGVPVVNDKFPADFLRTEEAGRVVAEMQAHYLGGVLDLDRGFGTFLRGLEQRRWLEHGVFLFTSDHGEAFGEHGELQHGDKVFEAKVRIPLFLSGARISPGTVDEAASLVDVPPTLAALAGLSPNPEWVGQSLLALRRDRPMLSFGFDDDSTFSVVDGPRKVIGFQAEGRVETERILGAFDLARDPAERHDLVEAGEAWPGAMLEHYRPEVERALLPLVESRAVELDDQDMDELDKLGYGNH